MMKTVRAKLIASIFVFVLMSVTMVTLTLFAVFTQESDTNVINAAGKQRMLSQKMVKEFFIYYSDSGEDDELLKEKEHNLKSTVQLINSTLTSLINGDQERGYPPPETTEIKAQLLVTSELWQQFMLIFDNGFKEGFFEEEEAFLNNNNIKLLDEMNRVVVLISEVSRNKVTHLKQMQFVFLVISVLVGIIVFIFVNKMLLIKLNSMTAMVTSIANERNLTGRLDVSQDEIGELAKGFNFFLDEFQSLLGNVVQATGAVNGASAELAEASKGMEADAIQQQHQTDQVATAVEEMNDASEDIASSSSKASSYASEALQVAIDGREVVKQTIDGINHLADTVFNSTKIVSTLGESSDKVDEIVAVIEGIAAQTNLLALNAAIEAARAGEYGRGFAVVADEVRTLAQRTSSATNEITEMIGVIQKDTKSAIIAMENGTSQAELGVSSANQAGDSLERIAEVVGKVTDMVNQIANAAEEQSVVSNEIRSNITRVAEITRQTTQTSRNSSHGNQALMRQVDDLQQKVSQFKL